MGNLTELADRVEALSVPSDRLHEVIWSAIHPGKEEPASAPEYTRSIDAAMTLLPKWLTPTIVGHDCEVRLYNGIGLMVQGSDYRSEGCTIAAALCVAALRARAAISLAQGEG